MTAVPVRPATPADAPLAEALYRGHPVLHYDYYSDIKPNILESYSVAAAGRALVAEGARGFVLGSGAGLAVYQPLAFDSQQFGVPAGRFSLFDIDRELRADPVRAVEAARALAGAALAAARDAGARHVSVRLDARDVPLLHGLEAEGFRVVDAILRFTLDLAAPVAATNAPGVTVRDARNDDVGILRDLAARGFIYDRFHNDPALSRETADRVHAEWVENAVRGRYGCAVLVAEVDGAPAGFFILAEDGAARDVLGLGVGTLVLITVGREFRRRGVARVLTEASARRLRERGNRYAEVGTQLANIPASNVYLASGFRLCHTGVSLRWWRP